MSSFISRRGHSKMLAVCGTQKQALAVAAGMQLDLNEWFVTGEGAALCGRGFNHIIVIQPVDRKSVVYQKHFDDWVNCSIRTRLEPGGTIEFYETNLFEP